MFRSLRRRLPRLTRWARLALAGGCLVLAGASALEASATRRTTDPGVAVVVAARDLPAGRLLSARDVALAHWPTALAPSGTRASPSAVIGRRVAGPLTRHEPITAAHLFGRDLTAGLRAGSFAVPVQLPDAHLADLVHAGDRVELVAGPRASDVVDSAAPADSAVTIVASRLLVLAALRAADDAGTTLVVAADRATALHITRLGVSRYFVAVLEPP